MVGVAKIANSCEFKCGRQYDTVDESCGIVSQADQAPRPTKEQHVCVLFVNESVSALHASLAFVVYASEAIDIRKWM